MDQCRSRLKLSENSEHHWSIRISGEIRMDQSLVHTFSWGNSYGPMVLKVLLKFPPTLALVHGWLFPVLVGEKQYEIAQARFCTQSCSKVGQLLVNSSPTPHPMGSCRGLPCSSPLATPDQLALGTKSSTPPPQNPKYPPPPKTRNFMDMGFPAERTQFFHVSIKLAKLFCTMFFCAPRGHGRPRVRVVDVHTQMLVFPRFQGPALSF